MKTVFYEVVANGVVLYETTDQLMADAYAANCGEDAQVIECE